MAKVIGNGYTVKCGNCGSEISFTRQDVKKGGRPLGCQRHDAVIVCPATHCNQKIVVTSIVGGIEPDDQRYQSRDDYGY